VIVSIKDPVQYFLQLAAFQLAVLNKHSLLNPKKIRRIFTLSLSKKINK